MTFISWGVLQSINIEIIHLHFSFLSLSSSFHFKNHQEARKVISAAIRAGIESGWIKPHIGKEFPLEGASVAHNEVMNGNGACGRIVLVP